MDTATRMTDTPSDEETARLRALVPLNTLPDEALGELLAELRLDDVRKGKMLFEQGDTDHEHVYLLDGTVTLLQERKVVETIEAGSDTARFPLAHQVPRSQSARAKTRVRIARIDSRGLSDLLARSQKVDYQVQDFDAASENDWMSMLLQSPILQQVPAANLQRVMMSVEQIEVEKGSDLVCQGDPGDFYYMLTQGRAVVRRDSGDGQGAVELATLGPGDAFGEEALLSDSPRNSTITMLQDGEVLRLSKDDFLDLIQSPLLDRINLRTAQRKVDQGAVWLDLRNSDEYEEWHHPGAINLPFESLRYQTGSLAADRHYVLYSTSSGRAMAGAFLLTERGFDVSVLKPDSGTRDDQDATSPTVPEPVDDEAIQERVREAEHRAKELEERLEHLQRDQENAANERQQHLEQVRQAVDQAKRKLLETEEQKREALAAQQQAYAEMERLTSNLEEVESERTSLHDRMLEIEGLDKQLQARLTKAERELIGERERAESATSSLDDLTQRLNEVLEHRELEREQHALERGELKEEMTALQLDLEQAQYDLQEQQALLGTQAESDNREIEEALQRAEQNLAENEAARTALQTDYDTLAEQHRALTDEVEQLRAGDAETGDLRDRLAQETEQAEQLRAQLDESTAQRDALQARLDEAQHAADAGQGLQAELDAVRAELESLQSSSGQALAEARSAHNDQLSSAQLELEQARQQLGSVQAELDQVRSDQQGLQNALAASNETSQDAIAQAQARASELETELHDAQRLAADQLSAAREEFENTQSGLQSQLDDALSEADKIRSESEQAFAAADQQAQQIVDEFEAQLELLRGENEALRNKLDVEQSHGEQHVEGLRAELQEVKQALEEREQALTAARAEHTRLTEALDAVGAERETLQLALNDDEDQQARVRDLELQLEDAQRTHASELLAHEQAQQALREQLEDDKERRQVLQKDLDRLNGELAERGGVDDAAALRDERDQLLADLAARDGEVEQLRDVIAAYVDQVRSGQSDAEDSKELAALRAELEMVREQAVRDLAQMREQLAAAETRKRRLQQADDREAISHEAMRQRIEALEASLGERQRELNEADEARHMLEDGLEDANRQLDQLRRELERAQAEADESLSSRREAEKARGQLQQALQRLQNDAEEARVTDLRDDRLRPSKRSIGMSSVARPNRWLPGLLGAALVLAALEAASFYTGQGELFSLLLRLAGQ